MLTTKATATTTTGRVLCAMAKVAAAGTVTLMVTAAALPGASAGAAPAGSKPKPVKMALPKSVAPSPAFLVSGVCGTSGPSDTAKCTTTILEAIHNARKTESLGAIPPGFSVSAFDKLTGPEQIFAIADIERTARGEAPVAAMTTELDEVALQGAINEEDPSVDLPLALDGAGTSYYYGANLAEGTANALGADYYWMYDDGPDSPNAACKKAGDQGCWGHRAHVLADYSSPRYCPAHSQLNILMGAAEATSGVVGPPAIAEIFVNDCGRIPTDTVFTWAEVRKLVFGH